MRKIFLISLHMKEFHGACAGCFYTCMLYMYHMFGAATSSSIIGSAFSLHRQALKTI